MQEQEVQNLLDGFKDAIVRSNLLNPPTINFFTATKMLSLETKHSAFLAWLLEPGNEHCLKNAVLKKLLKSLYEYETDAGKAIKDFCSNQEILQDSRKGTELKITDVAQIEELADDSHIEVNTEKVTNNNKRIDMLIDIKDKGVVIAIENKIDSTTHDNQIQEYEDYVFSEHVNYKKKILIYLTKTGEIPRNTGGNGAYNKEWCMLDYGKIRDIIEEVSNELKDRQKAKQYTITDKEKNKLLHILGDYIEMVDKNILNTNRNARQMCKELLENPVCREAFDMLTAYKLIPTPEQISDYVCEKLGGKRLGTSKYWFYIQPMRDYFEQKNKEEYAIRKLRCVCQPEALSKGSTVEPRILIWVNMATPAKTDMTPAQKALLKSCNEPLTKKDGKSREDVTLLRATLVETKERGMTFEDLKKIMDPRIEQYKNELDKFVKQHL